MKLLGNYKNGNYNVTIFDNGTKIRETKEDKFVAKFPECIDIKITNYCDRNCPYCHENSTTKGKHAILSQNFIETLKPYTELAIRWWKSFKSSKFDSVFKEIKRKENYC